MDFAKVARIFVLPANFPNDELHDLEDAVYEAGGELTYDPKEARIFVSRIKTKKRAAFELRALGIWSEEDVTPVKSNKKRKHDSVVDTAGDVEQSDPVAADAEDDNLLDSLNKHVMVLKTEWLQKSLESGDFVSPKPFLIYVGRIIDKPREEKPASAGHITFIDATSAPNTSGEIESPTTAQQRDLSKNETVPAKPVMNYSPRRFRDQKYGKRTSGSVTHPALKHMTTSEHDFLQGKESASLPEPPAWVLESHPRANYACCRSTYQNPPNQEFLRQLQKIKEARELTLDEVGVRAYSTSIASLSAYPHVIANLAEITRLPGCSEKIAALWADWYMSAEPDRPDSERHLSVIDNLEKDEDLEHLKIFYDIWGVGAETARKFYFDNGWKDLDDVIEYGWNSGQLMRVQQIGVKFYDEFLVKIPRKEVEEIADIILDHARRCRNLPREWWSNKKNGYRGNWKKPDDGYGDPHWDPRDMVCIIVGGYRRGKTESNDVDVILSHRDEEYTQDLVIDMVKSLEDSGHITHTLTLHTSTSDRDQQTLPYRNKGHAGHGFDTLDKALCVWQDPNFDMETHDKNPNIHRRVDIIVSPWRTIGAAVLGWSGATTFERDIRRWCRKEKGWKFDSSGVRDRGNGAVLDFESPRPVKNGKQKEGEKVDDGNGWEDRERRLMEGLGIGWRPASERWTG